MEAVVFADVVVAVDSEDFFDYVAGAAHVEAVGGHFEGERHGAVGRGCASGDFDFKRFEDCVDGVGGDFLCRRL